MSKLKETQKSSEKIFSGKLIDLYFDHVELFNKIQSDFDVDYQEMRNTFNCGVGMVVIMHPEELTNMPHKDFIILGELIEA